MARSKMLSRLPQVVLLFISVAMLSAVAGDPTARALKKCPFGHKTLVNVPIIYGLVVADGPKGEAEMDKDLADHKYALGGCCVRPDSPKQEVACTTCGFTYSIFSTEEPKSGHWTLITTDREKLFRPLSAFWQDYPLWEAAGMRITSIMQSFDRSLKPEWEAVYLEQKGTPAGVARILQPWLARHGMTAYQPTYARPKTSAWRSDEPHAELELRPGKPGVTDVRTSNYNP